MPRGKKKRTRRKAAPKAGGRKKVPYRTKDVPGRKKSSGRQVSLDTLGELGHSVGQVISPGIGGVVGRGLGRGLGWVYNRLSGRGDYKITVNSLVNPMAPVPSFGDDSIRVKHREYLGDVFGSTAFATNKYPINPGLAITFPWLSTIASNFEQYRMNGLVFEFVSTSATALNSTNTALGKVILATEYNAANPLFPDTIAMLATKFSNYGMPAANMSHAIECAPSQTPTELLYVRTGAPIAGADIRLYDLGFTQFATEGMQASANIGGLWVSYDVTFCKPVLGVGSGHIPTQVASLAVDGKTQTDWFSNVQDLGPPQGYINAKVFVQSPGLSVLEFDEQLPSTVYSIVINMEGKFQNVGTIKFINLVPLIAGAGYWSSYDGSRSIQQTYVQVPPGGGPYQVLFSSHGTAGTALTGTLVITQINSYTPTVGLIPSMVAFDSRDEKKQIEEAPGVLHFGEMSRKIGDSIVPSSLDVIGRTRASISLLADPPKAVGRRQR